MWKLVIENADGTSYWTEHFSSEQELNKWLDTERTRPYWKSEFTTEITDITPPVIIPDAKQIAIQKGLMAQQVGAECIAHVYALNEAKFTAGTLTTQDFQSILADPVLQQIERLLWNGSLASAKQMIQSYSSQFFSADEIISIVSVIETGLKQQEFV